jgi:hypothetical protein
MDPLALARISRSFPLRRLEKRSDRIRACPLTSLRGSREPVHRRQYLFREKYDVGFSASRSRNPGTRKYGKDAVCRQDIETAVFTNPAASDCGNGDFPISL